MPAKKTIEPATLADVPIPGFTAPLIHDPVISDNTGQSIKDTVAGLPDFLAQVNVPSDTTSRLHRAPRTDPDDVTTAADRITSFWRKHRDGRIDTTVKTEINEGILFFTVTASVYKNGDSITPDTVAHATRSTLDPDPITQLYPQETAETASISRALRFLDINPKPKKPKTP